jgi:hypothetical protein
MLSTAVAIVDYRRRLTRYRELVQRVRPEVIVLPEDVVGPFAPLLIRAGHDNGVPSLVLPYTMANQQEAYTSLRGHRAHQLDGANAIAGWIFPDWVLRREGRALIRLPAPHVLGHAVTRVAPPDPWMMNSGFANRIAVENEAMKDYYRRSGLPESKLQVVGSISDDHLARFIARREDERARLAGELGLQLQDRILLVGGCPDQLAVAPGFAFPGYEEMVAHLVRCLEPLRGHYTLLMRPHPNFTRLVELFEDQGVRCCLADTARLVGLADAYLAFASATLRWAIAVGIPCVNYDAFHYGYDDYREVESVLHATEPKELEAAAVRLDPTHPGFAALERACRLEAPRWGTLDGRSAARVEALIQTLCHEKPVRRTSAW